MRLKKTYLSPFAIKFLDTNKWYYIKDKGFINSRDKDTLTEGAEILGYNFKLDKPTFTKIEEYNLSYHTYLINIDHYMQSISEYESPIYYKLIKTNTIVDPLYPKEKEKIFKANYTGKSLFRISPSSLDWPRTIPTGNYFHLENYFALLLFFKHGAHSYLPKEFYSERVISNLFGTLVNRLKVKEINKTVYKIRLKNSLKDYEFINLFKVLRQQTIELIFKNSCVLMGLRSLFMMNLDSVNDYQTNRVFVVTRAANRPATKRGIFKIKEEQPKKAMMSDTYFSNYRNYKKGLDHRTSNSVYLITKLPYYIFPAGFLVLGGVRVTSTGEFYSKLKNYIGELNE